MKLYKIDFTNTIGDYIVTVPTDSQFLLGISNGDSDADVELLEGETEITQEDEKIGAYTVFNFETDGTPFRKHLKANINGQKPVTKYWDAHEYDITDGTLTGTMAILDDDLFAKYNPEAPSRPIAPTATEMTVKFKDASGNYSITLVYTLSNTATSSGMPVSVWAAPAEIDESITSVISVPKQIRLKPDYPTNHTWGWNKIEPNYTTSSTSANWKPTPLVADIQIPYEDYEPYTNKLNIVVKCDKMSVAYRDFEGGGGGGSSPVPYLHYYEVEQDETIVVHVTPDNIADIAQTCYVVNEAYNGVEMKIDQEAFGETTPIIEFYVKCTIESSDPNWYVVTVDENISLGDVIVPYLDATEGKIWHSSIHEMVYAPGMFIAKVRYFSDEQDATAEILYNVNGAQ